MYSNDAEIASDENRFRSKPGPSCQNRKHSFPGRSRTVRRKKTGRVRYWQYGKAYIWHRYSTSWFRFRAIPGRPAGRYADSSPTRFAMCTITHPVRYQSRFSSSSCFRANAARFTATAAAILTISSGSHNADFASATARGSFIRPSNSRASSLPGP
jgi:hypothetical protein